ncbi:MAG TPA: signal peptidase II [Mycobacteriales bacterium]
MSVPSRPPGPPPDQGSSEGSEPPLRRRAGVLAVTASLVLLADLVSKYVVVAELPGRAPVRLLGGALYLTHARNSGAAWGFAGGATLLFTAVAAIVVVVIVRTAARLRSLPWAICLGLILGGAAGNLIDRIFRSPAPLRGHVVDWISVFDPYGRVFPIFNLADSAIVCGGILAVLLALLGLEMDGSRSRLGAPEPAPPPPPPPGPAGPLGGPLAHPTGAPEADGPVFGGPRRPRPGRPAPPPRPAGPPRDEGSFGGPFRMRARRPAQEPGEWGDPPHAGR